MKFLLFLFSLVILLAPRAHAAQDGKWNLLLITADDMNADSVGWMGSKMGATPTLDALATTCHRFVNHHVTAPICQPSREALLTGRVPHRNGGLGFNPITPGTPTLVTVLKAAGYFTGAINKTLHMKPPAEFSWDEIREGSGKNPPLLQEHTKALLQLAAAANKPFFLNVNIQDPHRPFPSSAESGVRTYKPSEIKVPDFLENIPRVQQEVAQYFMGVARMDISLKGILEALAASGQADKTIVVFLSDHGMSFPFSKATVYYNGTWSPVLIKYPGMPAANLHEELVSSVDLMPTLLDLMKVAHPAGMDGRSWVPLLQGTKQEGRDYVITHVNTVSSGKSLAQRCIRTKDLALLFHAWPDGTPIFRVEAMGGITFKAMQEASKTEARIAARVQQLQVGEPLMFFNTQADPTERANQIQDPKRKPEIERLAKLLLAHMEKTNDPQTAVFKQTLDDWRHRTESTKAPN